MQNKEKKRFGLFLFICVLIATAYPELSFGQDTQIYSPPTLSFDAAEQPSSLPAVNQAAIKPPLPLRKPDVPEPKKRQASGKTFKVSEGKAPVVNMAEVKGESLVEAPKTLKQARDLVLKPIQKPSATSDLEVFKLSFTSSSVDVTYAQSFVLEDVLKILKSNDKISLSIDAYATLRQGGNAPTSRRIALSRGLAVRDWFIKNEVQAKRMQIRALGSDGPRVNSDYVLLHILK